MVIVPYFTRRQTLKDTGCDIFLQIPNNGIIVELRSNHCPADIKEQNWDLCHYTNGTTTPPPAPPSIALASGSGSSGSSGSSRSSGSSVATAVAGGAGNVTMRIWKMTYASSDPNAAADFCVDVMGATHLRPSGTLQKGTHFHHFIDRFPSISSVCSSVCSSGMFLTG